MSNETTGKTIAITLGVCLVCSILVSTATVTLRTLQKKNQIRDRLKNILIAGDLLEEDSRIEKIYNQKIKSQWIDLSSGEAIPEEKLDQEIDLQNVDVIELARHPKFGKPIPKAQDIAQIKTMPGIMKIYKVIEQDTITKIVLPVYGKGLWSTMFGFLALQSDLRSIAALTFYEHGETPGLGGEVDNPNWKALWTGKQAFDEMGNLKIEVIKGKVDRLSPHSKYQVDGLTGSTLTTRGVNNLIRFWLGDQGYGTFLKKIRGEKNVAF